MLQHLGIRNLAIIDFLEVYFDKGLVVITGESGAGKSLLVKALQLLSGLRADSVFLREGTEFCEVYAEFSTLNNSRLEAVLTSANIKSEEGVCLVRRRLSGDGRSRAFVNDTPVTLQTLKGVMETLLDLQGQNAHQLLFSSDFQLEIVNAMADKSGLSSNIKQLFSRYQKVCSDLEGFRQEAQRVEASTWALLVHEIDELRAANVGEIDLELVEQRHKQSLHMEDLLRRGNQALVQLDGDGGVVQTLNRVCESLGVAAKLDMQLEEVVNFLRDGQIQLDEAKASLSHYLGRLEIDEFEANENMQQHQALEHLARKHGVQPIDLSTILESLETRLVTFEALDAKIKMFEEEREGIEREYQAISAQLSLLRQKASCQLGERVSALLQELGMSEVVFRIRLVPRGTGVFVNGAEAAVFEVAMNNQHFLPLKKVASGGEMSRIALALAVTSADLNLVETLFFDEVDAGVSGAVADILGSHLRHLGERCQVICITHLAQVAAQGEQHLRVSKKTSDKNVNVDICALDMSSRVEELARILGGVRITEKTRSAAAELIKISRL